MQNVDNVGMSSLVLNYPLSCIKLYPIDSGPPIGHFWLWLGCSRFIEFLQFHLTSSHSSSLSLSLCFVHQLSECASDLVKVYFPTQFQLSYLCFFSYTKTTTALKVNPPSLIHSLHAFDSNNNNNDPHHSQIYRQAWNPVKIQLQSFQ